MATDADKQKIAALTRLALATREKVDRETYVLYLEAVSRYSVSVVSEACRRLEDTARWFPKKAELMEECALVAARHQERQEERARALLMPPEPSPERKQEFLRKLRELIASKSMK